VEIDLFSLRRFKVAENERDWDLKGRLKQVERLELALKMSYGWNWWRFVIEKKLQISKNLPKSRRSGEENSEKVLIEVGIDSVILHSI
jgi:hypothetical protein